MSYIYSLEVSSINHKGKFLIKKRVTVYEIFYLIDDKIKVYCGSSSIYLNCLKYINMAIKNACLNKFAYMYCNNCARKIFYGEASCPLCKDLPDYSLGYFVTTQIEKKSKHLGLFKDER